MGPQFANLPPEGRSGAKIRRSKMERSSTIIRFFERLRGALTYPCSGRCPRLALGAGNFDLSRTRTGRRRPGVGGPQSPMLQDVRRHVKPAAHDNHHRRHTSISAVDTSRAPPPVYLDLRRRHLASSAADAPIPPGPLHPPTLTAAALGSAPPTRRRPRRPRSNTDATVRERRQSDCTPVVKDELPDRSRRHIHGFSASLHSQPSLFRKQERDRRRPPTHTGGLCPDRSTPPPPDPRPARSDPTDRAAPRASTSGDPPAPSPVRRHPSVRQQIRCEMRLRRSADPRWHSPKRPPARPATAPTEFHPNLCPIGTSETLCRADCAGPRTR